MTGISVVSVYDTVSKQITEYPFEDYSKTYGINMLIPLDATCSACLFAASWRHGLIVPYDKLKPLFLVKVSDIANLIEFFQTAKINRAMECLYLIQIAKSYTGKIPFRNCT